jgi:hypothetical protein
VEFPIDYSLCYHLLTVPYLRFVVGTRPVFTRGETRMRMDYVVRMVLGGTLTKFFGPRTDDITKEIFEIRFLLCWNFSEPPYLPLCPRFVILP